MHLAQVGRTARVYRVLAAIGLAACATRPRTTGSAAASAPVAVDPDARSGVMDLNTYITIPTCAPNETTPVPRIQLASVPDSVLRRLAIGEIVVDLARPERRAGTFRALINGRDSVGFTDSTGRAALRGVSTLVNVEARTLGYFRVTTNVQRRVGFSDTVVFLLRPSCIDR